MASSRTLQESIDFIQRYHDIHNHKSKPALWTSVILDGKNVANIDFNHRPSIAAAVLTMEAVINLGLNFALQPVK